MSLTRLQLCQETTKGLRTALSDWRGRISKNRLKITRPAHRAAGRLLRNYDLSAKDIPPLDVFKANYFPRNSYLGIPTHVLRAVAGIWTSVARSSRSLSALEYNRLRRMLCTNDYNGTN